MSVSSRVSKAQPGPDGTLIAGGSVFGGQVRHPRLQAEDRSRRAPWRCCRMPERGGRNRFVLERDAGGQPLATRSSDSSGRERLSGFFGFGLRLPGHREQSLGSRQKQILSPARQGRGKRSTDLVNDRALRTVGKRRRVHEGLDRLPRWATSERPRRITLEWAIASPMDGIV